MDLFLHQILAGLATGGIYASVALALVMIYQATHLVNFAQGEMAMFATYLAWALLQAGVPYWGAFAITVVSAFVLGVAVEPSSCDEPYVLPNIGWAGNGLGNGLIV